MTYLLSQDFKRPVGFHLRVRFSDGFTAADFSARLAVYFRRKSGYVPLRVSAFESDVGECGGHYHIALVIDGSCDRKYAVLHFLSDLKRRGYLNDYKLIHPAGQPHGVSLSEDDGKDQYFEWLSYIAKTATKPLRTQCVSSSQSVYKATAAWRRDRRPMLHNATTLSSAAGSFEIRESGERIVLTDYMYFERLACR